LLLLLFVNCCSDTLGFFSTDDSDTAETGLLFANGDEETAAFNGTEFVFVADDNDDDDDDDDNDGVDGTAVVALDCLTAGTVELVCEGLVVVTVETLFPGAVVDKFTFEVVTVVVGAADVVVAVVAAAAAAAAVAVVVEGTFLFCDA
jgi:hypothetical protein